MPLSVLSVGYPFAAVTADPAGGAEQVLAQLDRALVAAGHASHVVAPDGSSVRGELTRLRVIHGTIDAEHRASMHEEVRRTIRDIIETRRPDVVHLHGFDFHAYLPPPDVPTLVTLHLPLDWYPPEALRPARAATWLQPVSDDQVRRGPADLALLPPIANGVDLDSYKPAARKEAFVLVLGRIAPEKGFQHALDAARLAGVPARAAGRLYDYPEHHRYFAEQVRPRLDRLRTWIGPVDGSRKRHLIAAARCLLVPSIAAETSSLVAMEALASGTPVIAFRSGALPDIVDHGTTGFIVDTTQEMAEAIARIDAIDPGACRQAACARHGLRRTTDAYLQLYERLAA